MTIKVETIRIMDTNQNFETAFRALFIFDSMMTDCGWMRKSDANITSLDMMILKRLIINRDELGSIDPYIASMVESYRRSKDHVIMNIAGLDNGAVKEHYGSFIVNDLAKIDVNKNGMIILRDPEDSDSFDNCNEEDYMTDCNLISSNLFNLLPNIKSLIIKTRGEVDSIDSGDVCYPFNVFAFVNIIIKSSTWQHIQIQHSLNEKDNSWIDKLWTSLSAELQRICEENGLFIKYDSRQIEDWNSYIVSFMITRLR